jgi:hypothetical protein
MRPKGDKHIWTHIFFPNHIDGGLDRADPAEAIEKIGCTRFSIPYNIVLIGVIVLTGDTIKEECISSRRLKRLKPGIANERLTL